MRTFLIAAMTLATVALPAAAPAQAVDPQGYPRAEDRRPDDRRADDRRADDRRPDNRRFDDRRPDDRRDDRRDYGDHRDHGDRRDWRAEGREWREGDRFDAGRYYAPRGYAYRSWTVGSIFPRSYWLDQRYWINDSFAYRLPPVPYRGARWVRYGPDAVLLRVRDGRILQVIRGRFY